MALSATYPTAHAVGSSGSFGNLTVPVGTLGGVMLVTGYSPSLATPVFTLAGMTWTPVGTIIETDDIYTVVHIFAASGTFATGSQAASVTNPDGPPQLLYPVFYDTEITVGGFLTEENFGTAMVGIAVTKTAAQHVLAVAAADEPSNPALTAATGNTAFEAEVSDGALNALGTYIEAGTTITAGAVGNNYGVQACVTVTEVASDATLEAEAGSFGITGVAADLEYGREVGAEGATFTVTGPEAALEQDRTVDAEAAAFAVGGVAADLERDALVSAEAAAFDVTGQAAALEQGRRLSAEAAAFVFTGIDAVLTALSAATLDAEGGVFVITGGETRFGRSVVGDAGAFVITGGDAALERGLLITAEGTSFAFTGAAANLLVGKRLDAEADAFDVTGIDAVLSTEPTISAEAGLFVFTGFDAELLQPSNLSMVADAATFAVTGADAALLADRLTVAAGGSFAVTGAAALFDRTYIVAADGGLFVVTGSAALLTVTAVAAPAAGSYSSEHMTAFSAILAAGEASTFERTATTISKTTGRPTTTDVTMTGVSVKVGGSARGYAALGLLETEAITLLFAPTDYEENNEANATTPKPGDTTEWQGQTWTVRDAATVDPDGAGTILARVVCSL